MVKGEKSSRDANLHLERRRNAHLVKISKV